MWKFCPIFHLNTFYLTVKGLNSAFVVIFTPHLWWEAQNKNNQKLKLVFLEYLFWRNFPHRRWGNTLPPLTENYFAKKNLADLGLLRLPLTYPPFFTQVYLGLQPLACNGLCCCLLDDWTLPYLLCLVTSIASNTFSVPFHFSSPQYHIILNWSSSVRLMICIVEVWMKTHSKLLSKLHFGRSMSNPL